MERTPEPDLMNDAAQVRAYADADFSEPNGHFVELFRLHSPRLHPRRILDLGCGPGDIARRLARAYPSCHVIGIDGALAMLEAGHEANQREGLADRVDLRHGYLPGTALPEGAFCAVVSNSLLHHLADPSALWSTISSAAQPGTAVLVMDLLRPESPDAVRALVETHAEGEPEILRRDFANSLHAAYRPDEVRQQLRSAALDTLAIEVVSDRHLIVHGRIASPMENA